ncbi:spz5 [Drosophila busckii]|uniref:Spz5 n=1 Tax=Drosophila busckii TaxID=30019 RepID=A0A0M3QVS6_DROBS|nr:spz5 [Drosophila busckii]
MWGTYLIKSLVRKWGYEAATLLVDETWETFETVAWQHTPVFYDPKSIFRPPGYGQDFNGYSYQTPFGGSNAPQQRPATGNSLFPPHQANPQAATEGPTFLLYTSNGAQRPQQQSITSQLWAGKTTPYNATIWLKRLVRDVSLSKKAAAAAATTETETETESVTLKPMKERSTRDVSLNMDLLDIVGVKPNDKQTRTKRQSSSRSTLCETTSQFITPQAALNSHGNWMFVVNEENTARQMVKAELCASNTCSNLCDLPNGYNSRCEQKFVQKRLIALQGNGQNLYTDTFWFPSCCVCTIAAN